MGFSDQLKKFNQAAFLPAAWFWLLPSKEVKKGQARSASLFGKDFAVYRGEDGQVRALEAYCPHMGAHLGDGIVEQNSLRCLFHNWKFDEQGKCIEIPCRKSAAGVPQLSSFKVKEKYGLIWLWTGEADSQEEIPHIFELEGQEVDSSMGNRFLKNCHPNVVMINAIDANHFNTVHNLVVDLHMEPTEVDQHAIRFSNTTRVPETSPFTRFVSKFYEGSLTYQMTYWYGHVGTVTIGPDFLHFHIMFALRPAAGGTTEGQTILITKKRSGILGKAVNFVLLALSKIVGNYFAKGDTLIFNKIKFNFRTPIAADQAIVEFARHYERQSSALAQFYPPIPKVQAPVYPPRELPENLNEVLN